MTESGEGTMSYLGGIWKRETQKKTRWSLIIRLGIKQRESNQKKRVGGKAENDCFNLASFSFKPQTPS